MAQLFTGLKILEFGGGAAGPLGTRYFADHGATVVRVESRQRPDFIRLLRYTPGAEGGLDGSHMFAMVNVNKYGIALNMSHPKGPEIARRLVQWADVLAENFAPKASDTIWWPKQMPMTGTSPAICCTVATVFLRTSGCEGSPGPFVTSTPSTFSRSISSRVAS